MLQPDITAPDIEHQLAMTVAAELQTMSETQMCSLFGSGSSG
jgi:hypothetical protein